jgi:phosphoribosylanthranilate isomerase
MPSGPGVIDEQEIAAIARKIAPPVGSFLLTSLQSAELIIAQQQRLRTNTIQLCDRLSPGSIAQIRDALPGIGLVQVIHVRDQDSVDEALAIAPEVDALLLDSGNQNLAIKELGGTGRTHDWTLSRAIVAQAPCPVFLAGGLNADNVRQAIESVRPFGIDLCSSVRTHGKLDAIKLAGFFKSARG